MGVVCLYKRISGCIINIYRQPPRIWYITTSFKFEVIVIATGVYVANYLKLNLCAPISGRSLSGCPIGGSTETLESQSCALCCCDGVACWCWVLGSDLGLIEVLWSCHIWLSHVMDAKILSELLSSRVARYLGTRSHRCFVGSISYLISFEAVFHRMYVAGHFFQWQTIRISIFFRPLPLGPEGSKW